jgi:hypothetical protein
MAHAQFLRNGSVMNDLNRSVYDLEQPNAGTYTSMLKIEANK